MLTGSLGMLPFASLGAPDGETARARFMNPCTARHLILPVRQGEPDCLDHEFCDGAEIYFRPRRDADLLERAVMQVLDRACAPAT